MKTERYIGSATPLWSRALRVVAGGAMVGLSFVAIAFPGIAVEAAIVLLSAVLVLAGIELIIGGLFRYRSHRPVQIGIGALVIVLAGLALVFPAFTAFVVIGMVAFALMFSGISSLVDGFGNKRMPSWSRALSIGLGALAVFTASLAIISPFVGIILVTFALALGLAAYGTRLIASGIAGQRQAMAPAASRTDRGAVA